MPDAGLICKCGEKLAAAAGWRRAAARIGVDAALSFPRNALFRACTRVHSHKGRAGDTRAYPRCYPTRSKSRQNFAPGVFNSRLREDRRGCFSDEWRTTGERRSTDDFSEDINSSRHPDDFPILDDEFSRADATMRDGARRRRASSGNSEFCNHVESCRELLRHFQRKKIRDFRKPRIHRIIITNIPRRFFRQRCRVSFKTVSKRRRQTRYSQSLRTRIEA